MVPVPSWGRHYIVSAFSPRSIGDVQVVRILASEDGTEVSTIPPQPGAQEVALQRGGFIDLVSGESFEVRATAPVLVGQFMVGATHPGAGNMGDPAFTLAVSIEQWRQDYIFLTPQSFEFDHINIVATTGTEVFLDGRGLQGWEPVGDGTYSELRRSVADGPHTMTSTSPFSVTVYGYGRHVSYAYPGGLNLSNLTD